MICLDLESYDAFLGRFNGASFTPEACGPSHFIHGNASDKPASVDALSKIKEALEDQALRSGLAKLEVLMSPSTWNT